MELNVSHDVDNISDKPIIMTLEDAPILEDGKLRESEDVLFNVNMRDDEIAQRNNRRKAKMSDFEDKFGDSLLLNSDNVLSKYDEDSASLSKPRFKVLADNETNVVSELEKIRNSQKQGVTPLQDLRSAAHYSSDYFTPEEMAQSQNKTLKKRRRRKFTEETEQVATGSANGSEKTDEDQGKKKEKKSSRHSKWSKKAESEKDIFSDSESKAVGPQAGDIENDMFDPKPEKILKVVSRGSRKRIAENLSSANTTAKENSIPENSEETGAAKLEQVRDHLKDEAQSKRMEEKRVEGTLNEGATLDSDEDADYQRVLGFEREKHIAKLDVDQIAEKLHSRLLRSIEENSEQVIKRETYNETEDFLNTFGTFGDSLLKKDVEYNLESSEDEQVETNERNAKKSRKGKDRAENKEVKKERLVKEVEEEKVQIKREELGIEEPLASKSMTDALKLYKMRGLLNKKDRYEFVGRDNDEKPSFFKANDDPAPSIRLEYLDPETGRPLTRKQAFRLMSHVFHGRRPGDTKKSKLSRKQKNLRDRHAKQSIETPLGLVGKLKQKASEIGKPYVELDQNQNAALMGLVQDFNKFDKLGESPAIAKDHKKSRKNKKKKKKE